MPSPHRRRRRSSHSRSQHARAAMQAMPQTMDPANVWLILAVLYWFMLALAMHLPGDAIPPELRPGNGSDGVVHALAYAGFAFLLCRTFDALHRRRYPTENPPVLIYFFIFLVCITYGYIDEETQPLTGRTADPADWEADVIGALIGCCLHLFLKIFFTADPAQLMLERLRRRKRRHRSKRRSRHGGRSSSSEGSRSGGEHSRGEPSDEHGDGASQGRRRRRRSRRPPETPDDSNEGPHDGTGPSPN